MFCLKDHTRQFTLHDGVSFEQAQITGDDKMQALVK